QLGHELFQYGIETIFGLAVGGSDFLRFAKRLNDQVDRPVIEMQSLAVWQHRGLRTHHACRSRRSCTSGGQALPAGAAATRRSLKYSPPFASTSSTVRISEAYPPSAS